MIFFIITGAVALGQLLAFTGATREFLSFIVELGLSAVMLVIIVQLAVLILGFFIDQLSIMLVAIPVLVPIIEPLGIDPVWFWVLFLMNISIGAITPPFGMMLFALKRRPFRKRLWATFTARAFRSCCWTLSPSAWSSRSRRSPPWLPSLAL